MDLSVFFAVLALIGAFTTLGFGIRIANELRARGLRANPLFVKWMIFHYLAMYKRVTLEESGEVGSLYHACSTAAAWTAILALAAILTRVL